MADELNGHEVGVGYDGNRDGSYTDIGGVLTNGITINNGAIDLTSKSTNQWREIFDQQGLQTAEISIECIFSSQSSFQQIRAIARIKAARPFRIVRGSGTIAGDFMVTNYSETSPDNDKLTASFTLTSDGAITGL